MACFLLLSQQAVVIGQEKGFRYEKVTIMCGCGPVGRLYPDRLRWREGCAGSGGRTGTGGGYPLGFSGGKLGKPHGGIQSFVRVSQTISGY